VLSEVEPQTLKAGDDVTFVASSYSTKLALDAAEVLQAQGYAAEVIDLRVINPYQPRRIIESVKRTGRLLVVDGGWGPCGMASEVIASVVEQLEPGVLKRPPVRVTLPFAAAPTSKILEKTYYPNTELIVQKTIELLK